MNVRVLGNSELQVSSFTLGTWSIASDRLWGKQPVSESVATIHRALEDGINFFDTAPGYGDGESERVLGEGLNGRRDKAIIATKISREDQSFDDVFKSCEQSLSRLQTDYIDLMQIHWPDNRFDNVKTIEALEKLKEQGKIRYYGVCNFSVLDMEDWLANGGEMVSNQLPYSLLTRAIEYEIVPKCVQSNVSILAYSPLMQGLLTGKFKNADEVPEGRARSRHFNTNRPIARHGEEGCEKETFETIETIRDIAKELGETMESVALAWLLTKPGVASFIVGARSVDQLLANKRALKIELPNDVINNLDAATNEVKSHLGTNPDIWENPSRFRVK